MSELKVINSTAENSCCSPTQTSACCEPEQLIEKNIGISKLIALIALAIAAFIVGDYVLPHLFSGRHLLNNIKIQNSLIFFIGHSVGLLGLLGLITSIAVFARSFINENKVRDHMTKMSSVKGHGIAAGIGVATPFCSCSAVPVFTGFVRSGVPVSQAISFLVASPLVNEIAVVMLATWAGWSIAGAYAATGFLIAIISGLALRRFATPALTSITPARKLLATISESGKVVKLSIATRLNNATAEALETISKTWMYVLIGVGAGAAIHGWVPVSAIAKLDSYGPVLGVFVAVIIGMPLYSGIATVIPVITALAEKGMPMGTLLAFAMSVTGLSLPEAMLLRSVMKPKLLAIYFATVAIGIIIVGILFNIVIK
jgi:uncharacterized membrane protein YraQ (UPF0718 family)